MIPGIYNFPDMVSGDSFGIRQINDGALGVAPFQFQFNFDITGYRVRIYLKDYSGLAKLKFDTEDDTIQIIDSNTIQIPVSEPNLKEGKYSYDMDLTSPDGQVSTILKGALIIYQQVSI